MTDADEFPVEEFEAAWQELKRRKDMSQFDRVGELLAAAADEDTLLGVCQRARLTREHCRSALSWFGLADPSAGSHEWPVVWRDEAIAALKDGELPDRARAQDWRAGE